MMNHKNDKTQYVLHVADTDTGQTNINLNDILLLLMDWSFQIQLKNTNLTSTKNISYKTCSGDC